MNKRKCKYCGATLKPLKNEKAANFAKRKYDTPECQKKDRRSRPGGWHANSIMHSNAGLTREDFDYAPKCETCGKHIMVNHGKNGHGIQDKKFWCICGLRWDEKRRAYV